MIKRFILSASAALAVGTLFLTNVNVAQGAPGSAANGKTVYNANCSACHGAAGTGTPGAFPPLAKNPHVTGDPKYVITTVLNGKTGSLTVNGQTYNGQMPAWKGKLSNQQIADVITYIRSSWGNKASAVSASDIK